MDFSSMLQIQAGVTALIGGGGKTSLLLRLGNELARHARVILCASAKMVPPAGIPLCYSPDADEIRAHLRTNPLLCVGDAVPQTSSHGFPAKITLQQTDISMLAAHAAYVLTEADGSKELPLKAHAHFEPALPAIAHRSILVVGMDALGQTIADVSHRPALYAAMLQRPQTHIIRPEDIAYIVEKENLGDVVFCNKAETEELQCAARVLAAKLSRPAYMGSIQEGWICALS